MTRISYSLATAVLLVATQAVFSQAQIRDPCANFCQNGGTCSAPADAPSCTCPRGFTGLRCERRISRNPCIGFICRNGGTCTSPLDIPFCECAPGFTGTNCETRIFSRDPCAFFPECLNGGFCTAPADRPYCECLPGFSGDRCQFGSNVTVPGKCPSVLNQCYGVYCNTDRDCRGNQLCCQSDCSAGLTLCVDPVTPEKEGSCPVVDPNGFGICGGRPCEVDSDCEGVQKCCENNCGKLCTDPVVEKPGICPAPIFDISTDSLAQRLCQRPCNNDNDCDGDQKCCVNSCGRVCSPPVQEPPFPPTLPPVDILSPCAAILCLQGTVCRVVLPCDTCNETVQCIPQEALGEGIDIECERQGYLEVILVAAQTTPTSYNQLKCRGPLRTRDCPRGSVCVDDLRGGGTCCRGKPPVDPCGGCPDGQECVDTQIRCIRAPCPTFQCRPKDQCGGCPKGQKCVEQEVQCIRAPCNPVFQCQAADACGGCPDGQVCDLLFPPCAPPPPCDDPFVDCIVPKCEPIPVCVNKPTDACGGCPDGEECVKGQVGCIGLGPCATYYECRPKDQCGGCPNGQKCVAQEVLCFNPPCNPIYQCQEVDMCGGCPDGQECVDTQIRCIRAPCPTYQCRPKDQCGGCPNGQKCVEQEVLCKRAPCDPVFQCQAVDECGGCPDGQICELLPTPCAPPPDCDALRALDPNAECIVPKCEPQPVCLDKGRFDPVDRCGGCPLGTICKDMSSRCTSDSCTSFQCVRDDKCSGCPLGQTCQEIQPLCAPALPCDFIQRMNPGADCPPPQRCDPIYKCINNAIEPAQTPRDLVPVCPLRCPPSFECQFQKPTCGDKPCDGNPLPRCVPKIPEPNSCPRPSNMLEPKSFLCTLEERYQRECRSDSDCRQRGEKCCLTKCNRKACLRVYSSLPGSD